MDPFEQMRRIMEESLEEDRRREEEAAAPPRRRRTYIHRNREEAAARLERDYFSPNPVWGDIYFRRRFRMSRPLFLHIANTLAGREEYFREGFDAVGRPSHTTLQKCTAAIRQLATGQTADAFDEYLHVGESTGRLCLLNFCKGVRAAFTAEFLKKPTTADCQFLLRLHEQVHGFPGMLGSVDCMHWQWKNCPVALRGSYMSGHKGTHPTVILEAVADYRLWIWHAYFGVPGSNNDINVLNNSDLFAEVLNGKAPAINFVANNRQYKMGYYLADGIYPKWPTFVKTFNRPADEKQSLFAQKQESARKDVERAFGVLQARWNIIKAPARQWFMENMVDIMYTCIILHNMIVADEGPEAGNWFDPETPGSSTASSPPRTGVHPSLQERLSIRARTRDSTAHAQLQEDLMEHIWAKFGNR